jgi:GAF domain-containing protein/HAMP domain-containing protein
MGPLIVFVVLLITFGLLTAVISSVSNNNLRNVVRQVSNPITTASSRLLFNPVNTLDVTEVTSVISQFVDGDTIIYAAVLDVTGTKLAEVSDQWFPAEESIISLSRRTVSTDTSQELESGQYLLVVTPISVGTEIIGSVVYGFDQSAFQSDLAQAQRTLFVAILGALICAMIIVYFVSQKLILNPLAKLADMAKIIGEGDFSAQVEIRGFQEISTLSSSLESMRAELQKSYTELENRVRERTSELEESTKQLEKRAAQFEAIAQLARTITSIQDLESLLPRVTQTVSQQFGFYHVGLFLLDESHQYAVLNAANSEGGQRMLARKHRLKVGAEGIVGFVTSTGNPRIALDTGNDAVHFDNPDLPNTRSEMALPLQIGSTIMGALDVQSTESNAFTEDDVEVLAILADEISVAIENARLFEESQRVLAEAQSAFGEFTQKAWQKTAKSQKVIGYQLSGTTLRALEEPLKNNGSSKSIPIRLRGQVIGRINVRLPENREWDSDELDITQMISERVGAAIENASLLEESRRRAQKESLVSEITTKIGSSINLRNVLQTAVEELGRAMPGSDIVIQFTDGTDQEARN